MSIPINIPIISFYGYGNGPKLPKIPKLPKFLKYYLIFSLGFGIYGFTRGYRGPDSTIKYFSKFNGYNQKSINEHINKISIKDKILNGIIEIYPFYLPLLNIIPLYNLTKRIELYYNQIQKSDYHNYIKYFTCSQFAETCYEII